MLRRQTSQRDSSRQTVKVTFALPLDEAASPVSVVGDCNAWDPMAHPLRTRSNGTRSVSIDVPAGRRYRFKYLAEGGSWFCEPAADGIELNEFQVPNSILNV